MKYVCPTCKIPLSKAGVCIGSGVDHVDGSMAIVMNGATHTPADLVADPPAGPVVGQRVKCPQFGGKDTMYGCVMSVNPLSIQWDAATWPDFQPYVEKNLDKQWGEGGCIFPDGTAEPTTAIAPVPIPSHCSGPCKKPNEWGNVANRGEKWECCECRMMREI